MSAAEPGPGSGRLVLKEGNFLVLQICYSKGGNPYLTGVAPVIPPPELSPPERAVQSDFERLSSARRGQSVSSEAAVQQ